MEVKQRGSKLIQQGEVADFIYIVKKGSVRQYLKQFKDKPNFKEVDAKKIFEHPELANS